MYQNFWQSDRFHDEIYLDEGEEFFHSLESNIFEIVYKEVGSILLKYTNQFKITCPNTLHYITLRFENEQPIEFIFQPNYILVEQLAVHPALKEIAESLQIEDLINHNQNDADYFQEYYQNCIEETFKSHIQQTEEIFLNQVQLLIEQSQNNELCPELQQFFSQNQFPFPQILDIKFSDYQQNEVKYQLFQSLKQLQSIYTNQINSSIKQEWLDKQKTQKIDKLEKLEQCENSDNSENSKQVQPFIVQSMNKEKIKQIIHWLIDEQIPIPEIILCAELKNRGNGFNLTFNPNQQILDIAIYYYGLFQNSFQSQQNTKNIKEEEGIQKKSEISLGRTNKIIECNLLLGMMKIIVQQKDALKDKILKLIKFQQLQNLLIKLNKVTLNDAHYRSVQCFMNMVKELESLYVNEKISDLPKLSPNKQKIESNDDQSQNEQENNKPVKCQKKYQRLLKFAVKLILIKCLELKIAVPEIMICLWFKKHKEKIVQGQIINQNSVQILPSKQKLIPYLQQDKRLTNIIKEVQLDKLLILPDYKAKELEDFEEFLNKFAFNPIYNRDVILIEQLLDISVQQKENITEQLVQIIIESAKLEKIISQLKEKLEVLPKLRTNKTQINDEPVLQNIIKMIEFLKSYINEIIAAKPSILNQQLNKPKRIHIQQQNNPSQQIERLDKEGLKLFVLSSLIALIENQVAVPEIIMYLGIKNKTQKFSLQINKNHKLQEYLTKKLQENEIIINEQVESKLLLKKIKLSEQDCSPVIQQRQQVSEPQLIIRALKHIVQLEFSQDLSQIWSRSSVIALKNQVYKSCSKKKRADTTIGQIKNLFTQLDQKYEQYLNK